MASGGEMPHMREVILKEMRIQEVLIVIVLGVVKLNHSYTSNDIKLEILEFEASDGKEYFSNI